MSSNTTEVRVRKYGESCNVPEEIMVACLDLGFDCDTKCWQTVPGLTFAANDLVVKVKKG